MSGILFQPIHEMHLLSEEPDALITIQGNSLLATNEPYTHITPTSLAVVLGKDPNCPIFKQCVSFLEGKIGRELYGNAKEIETNYDKPCVGCGVIFWGGTYGHAAYITSVGSETFEIEESNYYGCGVISTRTISIDSPLIKGFIR